MDMDLDKEIQNYEYEEDEGDDTSSNKTVFTKASPSPSPCPSPSPSPLTSPLFLSNFLLAQEAGQGEVSKGGCSHWPCRGPPGAVTSGQVTQ